MQIVSGTMYKDVTAQDFDHYFRGTGMILNLTGDKKRLYVVEGIGPNGVVTGSYLNRENEWKQKTVDFSTWYKHLDVIPPTTLLFNVGKSAAIWTPPMARNLKKSFPYTTSTVKMYGQPTPEESTEQRVAAAAFDIYSHTSLPNGDDALRSDRTAAAILGGFVLDKHARKVYFKKIQVGKIARTKGTDIIELSHNKSVFRDLLIREGGVIKTHIEVLPEPKKEEPAAPQAAAAGHLTNWETLNWPQQFGQFGQQTVGGVNFAPPGGDATATFAPQAVPLGELGNVWGPNLTSLPANSYDGTNVFECRPENINLHWSRIPTPIGEAVSIEWHRNAYSSQFGVPVSMFRRPRWGKGYACTSGMGLIYTFQGPTPANPSPGMLRFMRWGQ